MSTVDRLVADHEANWLRVGLETGGSTPSQYAIPKDAEELQDLIEHRDMSFSLGNIFKACYRLGLKDSTDVMYDLRKIEWFVGRLIKQEQNK